MPKRYLLNDPSIETRAVFVAVRLSRLEYNEVKRKALIYCKGNVSSYLRASAKFYEPTKDKLIVEEVAE